MTEQGDSTESPTAPSPQPTTWDRAIQVIGLSAGLAAWIAVVGGAKVWARLESGNIPATQTLAGLPRELMIVEGFQTMLVPILLGIAAALAVLAFGRFGAAGQYGERATIALAVLGGVVLLLIALVIAEPTRLILGVTAGVAGLAGAVLGAWRKWKLAVFVVPTILALGVARAFSDALVSWAILAMAVVTLVAVLLTLIFVSRVPRGYAPLTLFIAFALWAGVLGYVQEAGDETPRLERADVMLREGDELVRGYYLGRGGGKLYLARDTEPQSTPDDPVRHVLVLPDEDIEWVRYGREKDLPESEDPGQELPGEGPGGDPDVGTTPEGDPKPGGEPPRGGGDTSGGETEPEPDPDQPPLPLPAAIDRRSGTIGGVRVELQVVKLVRNENVLELDARLINVSHVHGPRKPLQVGAAFDDRNASNESFTIDALRLVAPRLRELIPVDHDEKGDCACTAGLDHVVLEPTGTAVLWAAFPAPDEGASKLDLTAPGIGWIRNVKVD